MDGPFLNMGVFKSKSIQLFSDSISFYDEYSFIQKRIAEDLLQNLPSGFEPKRILEIGAGTGHLTHLLVQKFKDADMQVTDAAPNMVDYLQQLFKKHQNISVRQLDGEALNEPPESFDLIISSMTAQWFEGYAQTLVKWRAALSASGLIAVSRLSANSFPEWRATLKSYDLENGLIPCVPALEEAKEEILQHTYSSTLEFLQSIKKTGATTPRPEYKPMSNKALKQVIQKCDQQFGGTHSWHILYEIIEK